MSSVWGFSASGIANSGTSQFGLALWCCEVFWLHATQIAEICSSQNQVPSRPRTYFKRVWEKKDLTRDDGIETRINPVLDGTGRICVPFGSIWLHLATPSLSHVAGLALCWTLWLLGSTVAKKDTKGTAESLMNLMILKDLKTAVSCYVLDNWWFFICRLLIYFVPRIDPRRPESYSVDNECRKMCWLENVMNYDDLDCTWGSLDCIMAYGIEIQTLLGVFCNVEEPAARLSTSLGMPLLSVSSAMLLGCTICLECTTHVTICHDMPMLCK